MALSRLLRLAFALAQTVFWTCLLLVMIAVQRLRKGAEVFQPRRRPRPACLDDPQLGTHQFATVAGVKLHYVEKGDKSKPLLVLIHGFPSFWYCWRLQLKDLSRDYWVVALDMRGHGESHKPADWRQYKMDIVAGEMADFVLALGRTSCTIVGNDWSGIIAYRLAELRPSLVERLIIVSAPHPHAYHLLLWSSWDQMRRSWYVFLFQLPWLPETMLSMNDFNIFRRLFSEYPDVLDAHRYMYSQQPNALKSPVDFYRANFDLVTSATMPEPARILCPVLVLWGEKHPEMDPVVATMASRYADSFKVRFVKEATHWMMLSAPDVVNAQIREFMEQK